MSAKQMRMKPAERRRVPREVLAQQPKGKLRLYTSYQNLDVVEIRDVSPFGVGIRLNVTIDNDAQVRLKYICKSIKRGRRD